MRPFDVDDEKAVQALRVLAIDQVEAARSGHPGLPLGAAPMAYALWSRFLRFDPTDPAWPDRDRFVLSAGHGSALHYALLHLFGFDLPLAELRRFRQWGSKTPGHPEHGHTAGVESTTGPLGQGIAMAVGMALAERHLAARFGREGLPVVDHRTWVIASDGDMMEGISHEAASLAGHLRLGRLTVLYDDNHISIDGPTSLSFSEDVAARFAAYGWRVLHVADGNDLTAIAAALADAAAQDERPSLICIRTHIGFGSPKQDTAEVHGSPLGPQAVAATRAALGWPVPEPFVVPDEIRATFLAAADGGREARAAWLALLDRYRAAHPDAAAELERRWRGDLPAGWDLELPEFDDGAALATREASGRVLNALAARIPELAGGSADLTPSNNTLLAGESSFSAADRGGRNLRFGVREHGMAAIANGIALHGGIRPYVATFLVFSDYMRGALRLSALQGLPVVYVFTHDSIALGEDGPTHQPVEHIVALRLIPNLVVLRPADARETAEAWRIAVARTDGPTALLLSRQKLAMLPANPDGAVERGAWVCAEALGGAPEVVLVATGSEVQAAIGARGILEAEGVATRVVSAPSLELLARQGAAYARSVLGPRHALKVAIEAGRGQGWHRWVGDGELIVMSRFGASAPAEKLQQEFGFTAEAVAARVRQALASRRPTPAAGSVPAARADAAAMQRARLGELRAIDRLLARDSALWGDRHVASVARRLGWLDLATRSAGDLPALEALVAALVADGIDTLVLLGMGGSSLAPHVLREIGGSPSGRTLHVVDTTDPDRVGAVADALEACRTAVVAVSKSGTTAETSAQLEILWDRFARTLGDEVGRHFMVLTEPATPLVRLATERRFRAVLAHPVDVGGRFSALSAVGLLPALWLGHDAEAMLAAAGRALRDLDARHPAVELAAHLAAAARDGWGFLALCGSPRLQPFGVWAEQLVAESTGKERHGILPVICDPSVSPPTWPGSVVLSLRFAGEECSALDTALDAVAAHETTVLRWTLPADGLGEAFVTLELATALVGVLLGINPFDEPDVVRAKDRARAALARAGGHSSVPTPEPAAALARHLEGLRPGDAIVVLAYLPETIEIAQALDALATTLGRRHGVPVTAAFGPRYLHSTGQLHKGAPTGRIVPVLLTADPVRDLPIPGQAHTLGQLRRAQAAGDGEALAEVGRDVLSLHFGPDPLAALTSLAASR